MASYRERSEQNADELVWKYQDAARAEARRRSTMAIQADDIEEAFLWLDVWAVLDKRAPW